MCKFLSALYLRSGDLLADPEHTDSHEDLIEVHGLRDDGRDRFVRVEFTPDKKEAPGDLAKRMVDLAGWSKNQARGKHQDRHGLRLSESGAGLRLSESGAGLRLGWGVKP